MLYFDSLESDSILIQIPRGTYVPQFNWRSETNKNTKVSVVVAESVPVQVLKPPIIAVFPMENQGSEAHAYFVDGLGAQLTAVLSQFSDLRVIAYCSTASFKDKSKDVPSFASMLGADLV